MKNFEQKWENLTLADDFMFGKSLYEPDLFKDFLLKALYPTAM